jgi:hypothetical protein
MTREEFLETHNCLLGVENMAFKKRINMMSGLLDDTMKVFQSYLNVPEANAVRERWLALKNELGVRIRDTQA